MSVAFGCPFEGEVPVARVVELARRLAEAEPVEIALADTIGVGVPTQVSELVARVRDAVPGMALRCHFHNTRNTGLANAFAAVQAGVRTLDASLGGIGGCPFAPAATGNIPTEDLVYLLHRCGYPTGVDLAAAIATGRWLQEQLGRPVPGMLVKAGEARIRSPHPSTASATGDALFSPICSATRLSPGYSTLIRILRENRLQGKHLILVVFLGAAGITVCSSLNF